MNSEDQIIQHLNVVLRSELTAINQYFLHARLLEHWGVARMARSEYDKSIVDMRHADCLMKRIILLNRTPKVAKAPKLYIGQDVPDIIKCNLRLELEAVLDLRRAIFDCELAHDYVSRDMLIKIFESEEAYIDHLETQLTLIETQGLKNYIQLQSMPCDDH